MPKDPARNVDRYKIRGGQLNEFDFHRDQQDFAQQGQSRGEGRHGAEEASGLPPDQAKAARTRQLLAAHGESVPETDSPPHPNLLPEPEAPHPVHDIEGDKAKVASARSAPTPKRSREEIETMAAARRASDRVPARGTASANRTTKGGAKQGSKGAKQASANSGNKAGSSKATKQAATQKKSQQGAAGKTANQSATKKGAKQAATPARKAAGNKAGAGSARKAGGTATASTRSGSSSRRQR